MDCIREYKGGVRQSTNGVLTMTANSSIKSARVIAEFNRGRIDSKRAARLLKKAASKGKRKNRRDWK